MFLTNIVLGLISFQFWPRWYGRHVATMCSTSQIKRELIGVQEVLPVAQFSATTSHQLLSGFSVDADTSALLDTNAEVDAELRCLRWVSRVPTFAKPADFSLKGKVLGQRRGHSARHLHSHPTRHVTSPVLRHSIHSHTLSACALHAVHSFDLLSRAHIHARTP